MHYFFAFLCVIPSAWVNAEAQWHIGAGWSIIVSVIGFAFLAALFTLTSAMSFRQCRPVAGLLWGAVASIFILLNMTIALSGISAVRELASDKRAMLQRQEGDRRATEARLQALRGLAKDASTPAMIEAQMRTLSGWRWEQANQRLATAKEIAALQSKLDGWRASTEPAPASVDPGIDNLIALVVAIFNLKLDDRFISAVLSGSFALLLELGADLGPVACTVMLGRHTRPKQATLATPLATQPANPPVLIEKPLSGNRGGLPPDPPGTGEIEHFLDSCVEVTPGVTVQASVLYKHYVAWAAKVGRQPVSSTIFGTTLARDFHKKKRGGSWWYHDLELRAATGLTIVKS